MFDRWVIQSRRVLVEGESNPRPAGIEIRSGQIERILDFNAAPPGVACVDVGNDVIMPGIVDTHAHINEPGRTDWEGFQTATRAAAAGGITTVVDMPLNSIPATTTLAALRLKSETAFGKCSIDYGFWGGVVPGNADELQAMIDAGALGFKCFLIDSGVEEFPMSREEDLMRAMPILAKAGVPLLVHAELEGPAPSLRSGSRNYRDYLESRPQSWEIEAIRMMIRLAEKTNCRTHIVHLSAASALDDIAAARARGVPLTVETCPHYLHFESERIAEGSTQYKCAPPIRESENRQNLWKGLADGVIDFVVSDHSPCTPKLKALESGDFEKAWGGIAGLQFSMPVVWTEMKRRGFSLAQLSRWMSGATARFAGLSGTKGKIVPGLDADLVVWDPDHSFCVDRSMVLHRHPVTPYEGVELFGKISQTYLRGQCIYSDGSFSQSTPIGRTVCRKLQG